VNVEETIEAIAKFFNDLIGALVPGTVLAAGLAIMHLGPEKITALSKFSDGTGTALVAAGLLFASGHLLLAAHEHLLKPVIRFVTWIDIFDETNAKLKESYKWFEAIATAKQASQNAGPWNFNDLRNVAMSVSAEASSLGRRFMFISLFCNGVGTALIIMAIDFSACTLISPKMLYSYEQAAPWMLQAIMMVLVALTLFKRGAVFYTRAMSTPFSIAVAELKLAKELNEPTPPP
jgi:hypothetical protein